MAISVWLKVQSLQCTTSQDVVPEASNQMQYSVLELTDRQMPALLCMVKRGFDHRLILRTPCTVLKGLLGEQAHGRREKFCLDATGAHPHPAHAPLEHSCRLLPHRTPFITPRWLCCIRAKLTTLWELQVVGAEQHHRGLQVPSLHSAGTTLHTPLSSAIFREPSLASFTRALCPHAQVWLLTGVQGQAARACRHTVTLGADEDEGETLLGLFVYDVDGEIAHTFHVQIFLDCSGCCVTDIPACPQLLSASLSWLLCLLTDFIGYS
ncbi:uncharacterized protein LOC125695820 isoform X2 [Lagopus muta]|uniref:uncharacterized protein LOC125695820 isoform X2 n=1 Tax=Lagopus muta TaxID=64668 RepID=UPI0020A1E254|nr:uncharacterized protein LOC125695820 isoform X2 [Lagopus muta]